MQDEKNDEELKKEGCDIIPQKIVDDVKDFNNVVEDDPRSITYSFKQQCWLMSLVVMLCIITFVVGMYVGQSRQYDICVDYVNELNISNPRIVGLFTLKEINNSVTNTNITLNLTDSSGGGNVSE